MSQKAHCETRRDAENLKLVGFLRDSGLARPLRDLCQNSKIKPTQKHTLSEAAMKNVLLTLGVALMSFALVQDASAQTATQAVSLSVAKVYRIAVTGAATINLAINAGVAGTNALTPVSDATSTYAITQNNSAATKVTANLDAVMANGKLQIALATGLGTTAGTVDISNATGASALNVVTAIAMGAETGKSITYTFSANASEGLFSAAKTVTLTVVD
jgi:hypothetical protein